MTGVVRSVDSTLRPLLREIENLQEFNFLSDTIYANGFASTVDFLNRRDEARVGCSKMSNFRRNLIKICRLDFALKPVSTKKSYI